MMTTEKQSLILWYAKKYGISFTEARALAEHSNWHKIESYLETWRSENGLPAASSPLSRGKLLSLMKELA